ncbi:MAG: hypothetical protein GF334_06855 [Candidatus Altiarchaeales archaeon]|nr:hypothetical protein [Candidatus Altiarchaeales archaeon]
MNRGFHVFFVLGVLPLIVSASFIQMKVTLNLPRQLQDDSAQVNASLINQGDEAAHDVRAELILPHGFAADSRYLGTLAPHSPHATSFNVSLPDSILDGTYPVVLKTHYSDANAYPFSTITAGLMRIGKSRPQLIRSRMKPAVIYGEASTPLTLEILNKGSSPQRVNVRFILPDELKSSVYETEVHVPAQETAEKTIMIENFGALPESTYFIMAVIEYEDDYHYSFISSAQIQVKEEKKMLSPTTYMPIFFVLLMLVVAGFIYLQFRGGQPGEKKKQ